MEAQTRSMRDNLLFGGIPETSPDENTEEWSNIPSKGELEID